MANSSTSKTTPLLVLARRAIGVAAEEGRHLRKDEIDPCDSRPGGVFVTLKTKNGDLRGCIGQIQSDKPHHQLVAEMAYAAALEDPRFPALRSEEVDFIRLELSLLTPPRPIDPKDVQVGRHGLIATRGPFQGLLLPQVPLEWGWDRETFLKQTCLKAGISALQVNAPEVKWSAFEAEVVSEEEK